MNDRRAEIGLMKRREAEEVRRCEREARIPLGFEWEKRQEGRVAGGEAGRGRAWARTGLAADEQDGDGGPADRADLLYPLDGDVLERVGRVDGVGNEDDVRFRVGEGAQALRGA
jgi:hypothetical protein